MRTSIPVNNLIYGQVDDDIKGRIELPLYIGSGEIVKNFYTTLGGNLIYRQGFEFLSDVGNSAIYEFTFNEEQSYLLVFTSTVIKFWSYTVGGELVEVLDDDDDPLEVAHPYGADRFDLKMAQKGDVIYITHKSYAIRKLTRTAANAFNINTFSITGSSIPSGKYPSACAFYEGRLIYAVGTTLHGSKSADYDNLTVGTGASDGFKFDISAISSPILWLYAGKNSLICGTVEGIVSVNGGAVNVAITPTTVSAKLASNEGASKYTPIEKDGYIIYVSQDKRRLFAFSYEILSESFNSVYLNKASYNITVSGMGKMVYKQDKYNFIYITCGSDLLVFLFDADEGVRCITKLSTDGEFIDIQCVVTPNGNYDLFAIIKRGSDYYLERMSSYVEYPKFEDNYSGDKITDLQNYQYLIAEKLKDINFLDSSLVYDGYQSTTITYTGDTDPKSNGVITCSADIFSSGDVGRLIVYQTKTGAEKGYFKITDYTDAKNVDVLVLSDLSSLSSVGWYLTSDNYTGLDHLEGKTVSVVADGGYIGDFIVEDGEIETSVQATKAIIGIKYQGMFKTFNMGLMAQAINTQTSPKVLYKIILRMINSAGGEVGTDLYNLQRVQKFNSSGLYDIPPLPIDKDEEIIYNNNNVSADKVLYIVQNEPLPFQVAMIVPYIKQISNT